MIWITPNWEGESEVPSISFVGRKVLMGPGLLLLVSHLFIPSLHSLTSSTGALPAYLATHLLNHCSLPWSLQHHYFSPSFPTPRETCSLPLTTKMESSQPCVGKSVSNLSSWFFNLTQCPAWPNADPMLTQELLDLLQQAIYYNQLRKGANEGMSAHNIFELTI